jgi:hypothetical protein
MNSKNLHFWRNEKNSPNQRARAMESFQDWR